MAKIQKQTAGALRSESVFKVKFKTPPTEGDERTEFFFSSLAAIYDLFTPEQVGCAVSRLWALKVSDGNTYEGRKCTISREEVRRKAQKRHNAQNISSDKLPKKK